jgi:hypothetical protein
MKSMTTIEMMLATPTDVVRRLMQEHTSPATMATMAITTTNSRNLAVSGRRPIIQYMMLQKEGQLVLFGTYIRYLEREAVDQEIVVDEQANGRMSRNSGDLILALSGGPSSSTSSST